MKSLLIFRHAKSAWDDPTLDDHDRPLNNRGLKTAPAMGRFLKSQGLLPDKIITSSALRARKTAELFAEQCGYSQEIEIRSEIYNADTQEIIKLLNRYGGSEDRVMVVGHNPTLEELTRSLTGRLERLPTGTIVHVELPVENWSEFNIKTKGRLLNIWRPKELFS